MAQYWQSRPCPLCGSTELGDSPEVRAIHPAESMSWDEVKESFVGLRKDQAFFSYYRCQKCALLYCPLYFSEKQLTDLYSQMPDNLMGEDKATASKTQSGYVRWILGKIPSFNSYLELGPDVGLVTKEVLKRSVIQQLSLVEPNLTVHDELRSNSAKVENVEIAYDLAGVKKSGFELVVGIHVLDHLLNPLVDMRDLALKSRVGAHFGLVVHDEGSLLRRLIRRKWPPFCLQHPQLYNPKTLLAMLNASGWEMERVGRSINYFHLNHIAQMGFGVLGLPKAFSKAFPPIESPVFLGNMIALAKKNPIN